MLVLWGTAPRIYMKKVQTLQNRALKSVYQLPYLYPTVELYKNFKMLPIGALHEFLVIKFIKETILKNNFSEITLRLPEHGFNTRSFQNFSTVLARLNCVKSGLSIKGPNIFNRVPIDIRETLHARLFLKKVKCWLLSEDIINGFMF
jgi:hypothetical protein